MKCPLTTTLSFINHRNDLTLCVTELKCFRTFIPRLNSYCCNDYFCLSKIEENIAYAMVSFQDFHSVPKQGEVSICERDGRLCTLPLSELNVSQYNLSTLLSTYPEINITRATLHPHSNTYSSLGSNRDDNRKILMVPANEPLSKRLTRTFFEDGFNEALAEAQNASDNHPLVGSFARYLTRLFDVTSKLNTIIWPYMREQGATNAVKFLETRDWTISPIRHMRWHPHCFKLAVATVDDTIRIYTDDLTNVPIIKNGFQKCITSLAWRPLSAGELAVGCQSGILLWTLDPKSHVIRPLSQVAHFKSGNHFPVTSVEWNHNGTLLATASVSDTDILIWCVDSNRNMPLKRIGFPAALLKWSPGSERLCSTTVGNVFRVWDTNNWSQERWTVPVGSIQSAAWSPCSNYLLFVTTDDSTLYRLCFVEDQLFGSDIIPKQAMPAADLKQIHVDGNNIGGRPQSLCWSPNGSYVAIMFKDTSSIAIFATAINRHSLSISPAFFIGGNNTHEFPTFICFQPKYPSKQETILTIAWSTGRVQYFPFI